MPPLDETKLLLMTRATISHITFCQLGDIVHASQKPHTKCFYRTIKCAALCRHHQKMSTIKHIPISNLDAVACACVVGVRQVDGWLAKDGEKAKTLTMIESSKPYVSKVNYSPTDTHPHGRVMQENQE